MNAIDDYEIITQRKVHDDCEHDDAFNEAHFNEMEEILKNYGLDWSSEIEAHYFNSAFFDNGVIWDSITNCIDGLAIKDGVDMVRFKKGTLGFMAYYNGYKNAFEFVPQGDKII